MGYEFREARREAIDLLIGLSGGTGSGKTYTAMRLATGMCQALGETHFAVIDTENGRARHYADFFRFKDVQLRPPFSPASYTEAILAAAAAGFKVTLVDSMSHEWAGEGGVLEMQQAEHARLGGGDNTKLLSWVNPKGEHKRMVQRLLQQRMHIILAHRADSKIEIAKEGNRTVVREKEGLTGVDGWFPIAEKNLAFELTVSLLLKQERPGVPVPIKLQEQHKHLFPLDQQIDELTGQRLVEWAAGGAVDWVERIRTTWTTKGLEGIALQLRNMQLPAEEKAAAQAAYRDQWNTVAARQRQAQEGATS